MGTKKLYDMAVRTGEFTDKEGNTKGKFLNVGAILETEKDDGSKNRYMLLDRTFNPAGVVSPDGRSNVMVSLFKPKGNDDQQSAPAKKKTPAPADDAAFDSEIPF